MKHAAVASGPAKEGSDGALSESLLYIGMPERGVSSRDCRG